LRHEGGRWLIDIDRLLFHYRAAATVLYEILRDFDFNSVQIPQILGGAGHQPGALFYSATHRLLVDREFFIVEPLIVAPEENLYYIAEQIDTVYLPDGKLTLAWHKGRPADFPRHPFQAVLDAGPLVFPLRLRHWRAGDFFYPFGMNGRRQKLQDFFTNRKIPRLDKDRVWLLENGDGAICWVMGYRIDERFKINEKTARYVELYFEQNHRLLSSTNS
jgi:tRNA(Ile)-lysidine synthase